MGKAATKDAGKVAQKERFVELRAEGFSYADIAEKLGVSKPTLISWSKELSVDIANARAIRMDALFERFRISTEKRVEAFGKHLEAILAELDKRDLSKLSTTTLFHLALKYGSALKAEYAPPVLRGERSVLEDDWGLTADEIWTA